MSLVAHRCSAGCQLLLWACFWMIVAPPLAAQNYTVTTPADSGAGSLREAIQLANSDGVPSVITFDPGLGGATIALASPLPDLNEGATTIDADLGGDCVPDVAINGQWQPGANGLNLGSSGNRIAGLAIHSFDCPGCGGDLIVIWASSGNFVECNYLGTDLTGTVPLGTQTYGVKIVQGASDNTVRNNRILYNGTGVGIYEGSSDNTIGPGNEIAFGGRGVDVDEDDLGGYPDFAALTPDAVQEFATIDFADNCAGFHQVGGPTLFDGLGHPFSEDFGMRLTGELSLGAAGDYLFEIPQLDDLARLRVDSVEYLNVYAPGPHSVIVPGLSGGDHTIELDFFEGGGAARLAFSVSGPGAASLSTGATPPAGCGASQPGLCGELFQRRNPTEGNRITQNSLHDNSGLGISLNCCCSPLANDPGDGDLGANTVLNHPEIASVVPIGGGLYSASGSAPPDATVEVFVSDGDPSGFGEGRQLRGTTVADAAGSFSVGLPLEPGEALVTATATDPAGNTSEFGPNFALSSGQDGATVDATISGLPGATIEIPVYARDVSLTPLGVDRPAGERIQSLTYKVTFAPASSIASKTFARAGILSGLTPLFEAFPTTATTASYLGTFVETTDPIPFTLDAAPPGDQVLKLVVTLAADAPLGPITLTLDPVTTLFGNQAGTIDESSSNGWLGLANGQITVLSNAAQALRSYALSSAAIQLDWNDPNANETGFRLERSTDGASWAPVATLGANDTSYFDGSGLSPATLYYHRLVTLTPADAHVSNLTATSTFPASAAKTCLDLLAQPATSWAFTPSAAWNGTHWGVAWYGRETSTQDEIYFRSLDATTLAPAGPQVRVSASAAGADRIRTTKPVLAWSDPLPPDSPHWGVIWTEGLPGEPGTPLTNTTFFSLLEPDGSVARGGVRISSSTDSHPWEDGQPPVLDWDGTHWGFFDLAFASPPMLDLVYRRLDADGDVVLGPVTVVAPATAHVSDVAAAWNAASSKYGIFWHEIENDDIDLYFQVMEESTGALEGSATHLDDYFSYVGTWGGTVVADGTGWAVAWVDAEYDPEVGYLGITWMRRFDSAGVPLGPAMRLSDDPVADGGMPYLARRPTGFATFGGCGAAPREICRFETDLSGNRIGGLEPMTPADGFHSLIYDVASNGSDLLVVFEDRVGGALDLGGVLVPVADGSTPGPVIALSSGHDSTNAPLSGARVVPLGGGFAALWTDRTSGTILLQGKIWDGSGALSATLSPLTSTPSRGMAFAATSVGAEFAVVWRDVSTNDLWFARYDATGSPVAAETSVSTIGTSTNLAMEFSGAAYGLLWPRGGGLNFLRVAPDGTPLGADLLIPVGSVGGSAPQIKWTGGGWAIIWRHPDNSLHYTFLAPDGTPLVLDTQITTAVQPDVAVAYHLIWTGLDLGLVWSELRDLDPPLDDIYFVRLNLDGTLAYPPVTAVSTPQRDVAPALYWTVGDSRFHLVHAPGGLVGIREIALQTDGTVLPGERWWTNRNLVSLAWNGVTLGYVVAVEGIQYFETGECVTADATPPPCPDLSVGSFDNLVRLDWDPVSDPESSVFRYHVYRDGLALGKTWAATTLFDDGGFGIGATHSYQVRAMNGAWMESDACPTLAFSTTPGDANGDGVYNTADIFYLINFFFADGPPPLGNADANGDNNVTVTDIFYMINNIFSGGPDPVPVGGGGVELAAPRERDFAAGPGLASDAAPAPQVRSRLLLGSASAAPGATVRIPIDLVDRPGTPLGPERPFGERVQALALAVACSPCDGIAALELEPAGPLARFEPRFASFPTRPGHAALVATYDELDAPLFNGLASSRLRQRIATLVVHIAPTAPLGATLDLRLDPGTTMLSNQGGTTYENVPNGWLELADGRLTVGAKPTLDRP